MKILRAVFVPFLYMIAGISFMLALILNFMVLLPIEKYYFLSIALGISVGSAILAAFINRHKGWRLHLSVMIWAIFFSTMAVILSFYSHNLRGEPMPGEHRHSIAVENIFRFDFINWIIPAIFLALSLFLFQWHQKIQRNKF